jgi:hypothetical protein
MVSDVLSDAIAEIREWQRILPKIYGNWPELERVVLAMDELRQTLDTPPLQAKRRARRAKARRRTASPRRTERGRRAKR